MLGLFFSTGITLGGSAPEPARFQTETWFQYWNFKTSRRGTLRRSTAFLRVVGTYHSTHWPSLRRINVETVADDTPVAHPRWEPYAGKPHVGFWAVVNDSGLGRNRNSACVRHHRSGNPLAPTVLLAGRRNADDGRQIKPIGFSGMRAFSGAVLQGMPATLLRLYAVSPCQDRCASSDR